jgi:hypothetical protein
MKPRVRMAVAFVAGRLATGKRITSIFDRSRHRDVRFGGTVRANFVNVFDGELGAHFSGSGESGRFSLFHYGESHRVTLTMSGSRFDGVDHGTSSRFAGEVHGTSVTLFDYGEGRNFEYSI